MQFKILFISLLCFISSGVCAQNSFYEAGYLVQNGDTIQGFIERLDEITISKKVNFKTELNADESNTYNPFEIQGFGFLTDSLFFETVEVEIRQRQEVNTDVRFAKVVLRGYINLYKLQLPLDEQSVVYEKNNTFLYIIRKENKDYTLGQYEYRNDDNTVTLKKRYIGVMKVVLTGCPGAAGNFDQVMFTDNSMIKAIGSYNVCVRPDVQTRHYTYKVKAVLKHGPEISYGKVVTPQDRTSYYSHSFAAGYFLDFMEPDISRKLSTRVGVYYLVMLPKSTLTISEVKSPLHYVRIPILGQYNFPTSSSSKYFPFINGGMTGQVTTTEGVADITTMVSLGGGVYTDKYRFSFMIDNEQFKLNTLRIFNLSVGYRLDVE